MALQLFLTAVTLVLWFASARWMIRALRVREKDPDEQIAFGFVIGLTTGPVFSILLVLIWI